MSVSRARVKTGLATRAATTMDKLPVQFDQILLGRPQNERLRKLSRQGGQLNLSALIRRTDRARRDRTLERATCALGKQTAVALRVHPLRPHANALSKP